MPAALVAELYQEHHPWLFSWLRKKLGCPCNAADLAQDTFMRLLTTPPPLELREPRAYLSTVAHGLMVNLLRRRDLERAYLDALACLPEPISASPETRALLIESLLAIDALLDGLPGRARQAFLLSQLEGLGYAEIAVRLSVSISMVKKYMLQAVTHCMAIDRP